MNTERLLMTKALMDDIQADKDMLAKFDLDQWISVDEDDLVLYMQQLNETTPSCGFTACACGWAGVTKSFNDLGFWTKGNSSFYTDAPIGVINRNIKMAEYGPYVDGEEIEKEGYFFHMDFEAAVEFFDIPYEESEYLFSPNTYDEDNIVTEGYAENNPEIDYNFPKGEGPEGVYDGEEKYNVYTVLPKHVSYRIGLLLKAK